MRDAQQYRRLLDLLGTVLDQPDDARAAWLAHLQGADAAFREELTRLLSHQDATTLRQQVEAGAGALASAMANAGADPQESFAAGQIIGGYVLERPIGSGGMGTVWLARKTGAAQLPPVAIKLPAAQGNGKAAAERLQREGAILAALNHPNIARLIEVGVTAEGQPFLALEYIDGVPLPAHCDAQGASPQARLAMFVKVLDAMAYAHATLVLHRDVKPANVMVTKAGEVKLLDFGIAKLMDVTGAAQATELTRVSGRALTPDYASPEQIAGTPLTVASDVYSLGVMLYELLTGERPYKLKRGSTAELEEAILHADASRPSTAVGEDFAKRNHDSVSRWRHKLTGDIDTIVLKALKKDPAQRYATVAALREDIVRYLDGRPVLATADSFGYRARKFISRNRLVVGATAGIFLALVAGLAAALWQASVAREQARIARIEAERAEQVKLFLMSMFEKNKRQQAGAKAARDMTVVEMLKGAGKDVRERFAKHPRLKSELLATNATMLADLDAVDEALEMYREADEIAKTEPTIPVERRFIILRGRSQLAGNKGLASEALEAHRRMHALIAPENRPSELLRLQVHAAVLSNGVMDGKDIVASLKTALEIAERGFKNRPEYFSVLYELGKHASISSDFAGMEKYLGQAVEAFGPSGSKDYQLYIQAKAARAYAMGLTGKVKESIPLFESALEDFRAQYGADFPRTRMFESMYAHTVVRHGRTDLAAGVYARLGALYVPGKALTYPPLQAAMLESTMLLEMGNAEAALKALNRYPQQADALQNIDSLSAAQHFVAQAQAFHELRQPEQADKSLASALAVNEGKSVEFIRTNPSFRYAATRFALDRKDFERATSALAHGGAKYGVDATLPKNFDEEFIALNTLAAELHSAKGEHDAARQTVNSTLSFLKQSTNAEDYPFLLAKVHAAAGSIARAAGAVEDCLAHTQAALQLQARFHAPQSLWKKRTEQDRAQCKGAGAATRR
ncbi:MAG: serine/threonine protein kinase [Betaproteobacteria bacterium]|nr:serine/threonine protein kinase [Betaproteobacteria bacterium]